jgi:YHS domain-containing protein
MTSLICATCGCSLIRLGINKEQSPKFEYKSVIHTFCCQGCLTLFKQAPEKCLQETDNIKVCPTCLAEKPKEYMVPLSLKERTLYFCRCPYCLDTFNKQPTYFIERLKGNSDFKGLFADDEKACCH